MDKDGYEGASVYQFYTFKQQVWKMLRVAFLLFYIRLTKLSCDLSDVQNKTDWNGVGNINKEPKDLQVFTSKWRGNILL